METPIVIENEEQAKHLLRRLSSVQRSVFGLDCETVGIDPTKQAPGCGLGRIFCWSLSWFEGPTDKYATRAYLARETLPTFKSWLEDNQVKKVGHNIFGFDRHMFLNEGINLQGIVGDTLHMSKLVYNHPDMRHGLKPLSKSILGYDMKDYKELFSRPKRLLDKVNKKSKHHVVDGIPTYTLGS